MLPVRQFFTALLDVLFPPICHICHSFIPDASKIHICKLCLEKLSQIPSPICSICGIPFIGVGNNHFCGNCVANPPDFNSARGAFIYDGVLRDLIHSFKYNNLSHLRFPLATLMLENIKDFIELEQPELIIPVPLHSSRLRQRGFNQSVLLGQTISKEIKLPILPDTLIRIRRTNPQVELSGIERKINVKGAFAVKYAKKIEGKRILLVDDVMTTGSTMNECAKELKNGGASKVIAVTVARTTC